MQYSALIRRDRRGRRLVSFPDCPGCDTFAEPGEDLYSVAQEALEAWLEAMLHEPEPPPLPSMVERTVENEHDDLIAITVSPILSARVQIRARRAELGLTQTQLAEAVGVTQQAIAKVESPDANVRIETLNRVAAALGLQVDLNLIPAPAR